MRSEDEMMKLILDIAMKDERIRLVTLEGSRTNKNVPRDKFQDYDISYFVTDMDSFTSDESWLDQFGERMMMQKPEDMELFPKYIQHYMNAKDWEILLNTYVGNTYESVWKALFDCQDLFRAYSTSVAVLLRYEYPEYDQQITEYTIKHYQRFQSDFSL
ncbi:aminoglycoside 6-adenylyltransferase [Bacillus velezensis]|uniref:aminoglycoside 6-adenylyltransferase n=1 Tax=Bacillus velezensis TaxID=492670 RepID=UPI003F6B31F8